MLLPPLLAAVEQSQCDRTRFQERNPYNDSIRCECSPPPGDPVEPGKRESADPVLRWCHGREEKFTH